MGFEIVSIANTPQRRDWTITAPMVNGSIPRSWQFVPHSIPFVSLQTNPSLGLPSGAPIVELVVEPIVKPKIGSATCGGFFGGSAGAVADAGTDGFDAISGPRCFQNPRSRNHTLSNFAQHLSSRL